MKNFGIFCIGLGGLSLLGALMAGHSVTGPTVWLALGITLVLFAKQKEDDKRDMSNQGTNANAQQSVSISQSSNTAQQQPMQESVHKQNMVDSSPIPSEANVDIPMTTKQKEAAMCLISYFGGYNDDIETNPKTNEMVYALSYQASIYFQIHNFPEMLPGAMSRNSDPDKMLDTVMTIQDRQFKEFLLLTCHNLTKMSGKAEAYELLYNIANEMGYNTDRFNALIERSAVYTRHFPRKIQ